MNVHHLELFYYVAKFEGITAAVRKMPYGIQQPAVSGQLLQLESQLGVKLFNRRPFTLTPAGEELYDHIYPFFSKMRLVESQLKGEERHTLRIAAAAMVLRTHLPIILGMMKRENPDLKLQLNHVGPLKLIQQVQNEEVDLAISAVAEKVTPPLKMRPLLEIPIVLLLPADAPETTIAELLRPDAYERGKELTYPLVGMDEEETVMKVFQRNMGRYDAQWETSVRVTALDVIEDYVAQGFGIGIGVQVPGRKHSPKVKAIPLEGTRDTSMTLGILYQGKLKPLGEEFAQHTLEAAKALSALNS